MTFPPSSRQALVLPGKLAVRGLPGAKRRDAAVGRALDGELSRRQDRPAREDGPATLAGAVTGVRDGGERLAADAGERRGGGGPRRASQR